MRCRICPLYESWNTESDSGESCGLFGDSWDSRFMYEDKNGIVGCYIERCYIERCYKEYLNYLDSYGGN